jgi:hypothetical protein
MVWMRRPQVVERDQSLFPDVRPKSRLDSCIYLERGIEAIELAELRWHVLE